MLLLLTLLGLPPGALGFGATPANIGGTLGDLCIVTDDLDPGSLRDCIENSTASYVVRGVSATVALAAPLHINRPLTLDFCKGEGGFSTTGYGLVISDGPVILRCWISRLGDAHWDPNNQATGQPLLINQQAHDVLVDLSAFAWYRDDANVWSRPAGTCVNNVTIQRSIFAEPTGGKGFLIGIGNDCAANVSLVRNVFASSNSRHPTITNFGDRVLTVDWSQNVVYNMGGGKSHVGSDLFRSAPIAILVSGNVYRRGPNIGYMSGTPARVHILATYAWPWYGYDLDGISLGHGGNTLDGWIVNAFESDANYAGEFDFAPVTMPYTLPLETGAQTYANVLQEVARRPLDSLDLRILEEITLRTGGVKIQQPGALPVFPFSDFTAQDADRDGLPDTWEAQRGLMVGIDDHATIDPFTALPYLEVYLYE